MQRSTIQRSGKSLLKRKSGRTRVTDKKTTLPPTISNLITKYVASIQSSFLMLGSAGGALDCEVKGKTWESCLSRRLVFSSPQIVISAFILDSFLLLISLPSVVLLHRICSRPSLTVFNISSQEFHCQVFLWLLSGHTHTCNVWITHSLGAVSAKGHFL